MTRFQLLLIALAALFAASILACGEKDEDEEADGSMDSDSDTDADSDSDSDSDADPATVEDICDAVFDLCGGWGWTDQPHCYECFINGGAACGGMTGQCEDEDGYFQCVGDEGCVDIDNCDDFEPCEFGCWDDNCLE